MSFAQNGKIQLYYEAFGPKGADAVLLLNGAGRQCIDFSDSFCGRIAEAGFRVIRFDTRDTGWSTPLAHRPSRLAEAYDAVRSGVSPPLAYGLQDLANDAFAVLDAEGVSAAHLFGRSLGSAVAQTMALTRLERVLSLTLVMAFSRSLADTQTREALVRLEEEVTGDPKSYVERQLRSARAIGSPAFLDEVRLAGEARVAFTRGIHPGALARHFAVGIAAPDLRARLRLLRIPTLIIHGALDRVIPIVYAQETAAALAGSRLEIIEDMAHDGPPELLDRWAALFLDHVRQPFQTGLGWDRLEGAGEGDGLLGDERQLLIEK